MNRRTILISCFAVAFLLVALVAAAEIDLSTRPSRGPADAPVQIIEFSDFQCGHCAKMAPVLEAVLNEYGDLVRLTVVTITAPGHAYAEPAAELALTAAEHGKYWPAYNALFANQDRFDENFFLDLADELGIPRDEVQKNIETHAHRPMLKENFVLALKDWTVEVTPTLFINGEPHAGAKNADYYRYYINQALAAKGVKSPVGEVPRPNERTAGERGQVPLDMIFPVAQLSPQDSVLKVKVGDLAPDFDLPTTLPGIRVKLSALRGKTNVVLSFVPAAWTPQCSAQWPEYNEYEKEIKALDAEIVGISADNIPSLYSWTVSMGRPWFTVASDFWPHGEVAQRYGILRTDGTTERAVFVIDKQGVIRYIDVHDINTRPSIQVLLDELKKLND